MSSGGELDRRIGGALLFGRVLEIDLSAARVRVDMDGMASDWLPWCERRAGAGARTWMAPSIGEQVIVACPYGDPAQGVVIGSIYQEDFDAPANSEDVSRTVFGDGSVVEYDAAASRLTVNVGAGSVVVNCNTATITAADSVTVDSPTATFTGDVEVGGKITAQDDISTPAEVKAGNIGLKSHKHTAQGSSAPTTSAQP